jgi:formate dehydrogenase (coenzyme F420) beta subunit
MDKELQEIAGKLLAEKKVDWVIGYEKSYEDNAVRPVFINKPEDAVKLVVNKYCVNNLAVYLPKLKRSRVGIVAKGCDVRSIKELIKERQILKENVVIIGISCEGVIGKKDGGKISVKCDNCSDSVLKGVDLVVGSPKEIAKKGDYKDIEDFGKLPPKEKEVFWNKQFEKCVRCYACRNVCPVCYCPDCFAQRNMPEYLNKEVTEAENKLFQIIRMQHVFGRCTDCRACEAACPVGIPLGLITKKMNKDALFLFGYISGVDEETRPPLSTFKQDEKLEEIY